MIRRRKSLSQLLALAPWWISVLISTGMFILLQYVLPPLLDNTDAEAAGPVLRFWSPYIAILLIIPLPFALFHRDQQEQLVETDRLLEPLRALKHAEFVDRLVPALRAEGYAIEYATDARYDLVLRRGGERTIVNCKGWNAALIGARFVRAVQLAQRGQNAAGAKVITCGQFAPGAQRYSRTSSVELLDGAQLLRLLARVRPGQAHDPADDL